MHHDKDCAHDHKGTVVMDSFMERHRPDPGSGWYQLLSFDRPLGASGRGVAVSFPVGLSVDAHLRT